MLCVGSANFVWKTSKRTYEPPPLAFVRQISAADRVVVLDEGCAITTFVGSDAAEFIKGLCSAHHDDRHLSGSFQFNQPLSRWVVRKHLILYFAALMKNHHLRYAALSPLLFALSLVPMLEAAEPIPVPAGATAPQWPKPAPLSLT